MKIETINHVIDYLDNFYYLIDYDHDKKPPNTDRNGKPFQEVTLKASHVLFKNPEKVLTKMMISHIMKSVDDHDILYMKENNSKPTQWVIEWRIKPEYDENDNMRCASAYARFSIYPRAALKEKE